MLNQESVLHTNRQEERQNVMPDMRISRRSLLRVSTTLLGAGALSAAAGCGSNSAPTAAAGKKLTYLNSSNGQLKELLVLNAAYKAATGVDIAVTTDGSTYPQTLHARAQANSMPDLYYPGETGLLSEHAPYVKAGWAMDLTSEMDAGWRANFRPELLAYTTYTADNAFGVKPGIYSIPFDGSDWQFYALPALWEKAGLNPAAAPKDFDALLAAMKLLKKSTAQAFNMALSQSYVTDAFIQTYASTVMSVDEIVATCAGKAPWSTPAWTTVIDLFRQIRDANILAPGAINAQMPALEKAFFSQKALACFWGFTIDLPVAQKIAPGFKDFNVFMPPPLTAGKTVRVAGGMGKSVAVNAKSPNTAEAIKYLKWFMEPAQQQQYATALPAVPANPSIKLTSLDPRVQPFAKALPTMLPPKVGFKAQVSDALNRGVQSLMNSGTDAGSILAAADKAQKSS